MFRGRSKLPEILLILIFSESHLFCEEVKKWAPSFENYSFIETDGKTEVIVEMQVDASYAETFKEMWPKALNALKELSERA